MTGRGRLVPLLLAAGVVVLALGWVVGFTLSVGGLPSDPGPSSAYFVMVAVVGTVVAVPWAFATRMLWRDHRRTTPANQNDGPATLVALAVATLPAERRDWGLAMQAEVSGLAPGATRWRFALGCARAVVLVPRPLSRRSVGIGALVAALAVLAGLAGGAAVPGMGVLLVAVVGLGGAVLARSVRRPGGGRGAGLGRPVQVAGLLAVGACLGAIAYFLAHYPVAAAQLPPVVAVGVAIMLAGCGWLMIDPPRALVADRLVGWVAVTSSAVLAIGLLVLSRHRVATRTGLGDGILGYLYLVPSVVIFLVAAIAAMSGRSFRAGVRATVWICVLTSLLLFAVAIVEAVQWYRFDTRLILAGDGVPLSAVGENLRNFLCGMILLPVWWLPYGVIGAAAGGSLLHRVRGVGTGPTVSVRG